MTDPQALRGARALTVRQPWAALIAAGLKPVENRSWALPRSFAGPLLIHAGAKDDREGWLTPGVREALEGASVPVHVYGAVIAVAGRVTCHRDEGCCAQWGEHGAFHWVLEDVRRLATPISATGRLGLWRPDENTVAAALAASRSAGSDVVPGAAAEPGGASLAAGPTR
ncbi:hypothetical protein ACIPX0_12310 [Streptomyces sp. NPDC090075]|uniref:hypothetical protein n=1 Tax=Streptomyces sp. NPDC090075 TaxID=3365937 RepID=UPI003802D075